MLFIQQGLTSCPSNTVYLKAYFWFDFCYKQPVVTSTAKLAQKINNILYSAMGIIYYSSLHYLVK